MASTRPVEPRLPTPRGEYLDQLFFMEVGLKGTFMCVFASLFKQQNQGKVILCGQLGKYSRTWRFVFFCLKKNLRSCVNTAKLGPSISLFLTSCSHVNTAKPEQIYLLA